MARTLEELLVYQKAMAGVDAVSALIRRAAIGKDWKFRDQLLDAAMGVVRNIGEGFGQQSDRLFAKYLYIARGSAWEVRTELEAALVLKYISPADLSTLGRSYEEISRMLTGLIKYLKTCDRKSRG